MTKEMEQEHCQTEIYKDWVAPVKRFSIFAFQKGVDRNFMNSSTISLILI